MVALCEMHRLNLSRSYGMGIHTAEMVDLPSR